MGWNDHCYNPEDDEEPEYCNSPGPRGCGVCPGCDAWGDEEYERKLDLKLEAMKGEGG